MSPPENLENPPPTPQTELQPETLTTHLEPKGANRALGFGIGAIVAWLLPIIGLPISTLGIIFSIQSLQNGKSSNAIAGLSLSILGLILTILNAILGVYLQQLK